VGRLLWDASERLGLGWLGTQVERPFLDRTADVQAADLRWQAGDSLLVNAQVMGSRVEQAGRERSGQGGWVRANWNPSSAWRYELEATHFGQGLDFNDLGFMRRGSLNEVELTGEYNHTIDDAGSTLASTRWYAELQARRSDSGVRLPTWLILEASTTCSREATGWCGAPRAPRPMPAGTRAAKGSSAGTSTSALVRRACPARRPSRPTCSCTGSRTSA
jgi:hypothetical protein